MTFWCLWLLVVIAIFGPPYLMAFYPDHKHIGDFHQEWLSARSVLDGGPAYTNQHELVTRYFGIAPEEAKRFVPWNAHPPVSVLLALPLGKLDFGLAQFIWNLANLPLLILSLVLLFRELKIRFTWESVLPLLVVLIGWHSVYSQIQHAQINILLLTLITLAWVCDRRGWSSASGLAIGTAAALKVFPAFLFVYFLFTRNLRALVVGILCLILWNSLALLVLGWDDFRTYLNEVIPSLTPYQSSRQNVSVNGFWLRIYDPDPSEHVIPLVRIPILATILVSLSRVTIVGLVAWRTIQAKTGSDRDRAYGAAVVAMLLVSPIAWTHYFLLLALPLLWLWQNLRTIELKIVFWLAFAIIWLPNYYFPSIALGKEVGARLFLTGQSDVTPRQNLLLMSLPFYALLTVFLLVVTLRPRPTVPPPTAQ